MKKKFYLTEDNVWDLIQAVLKPKIDKMKHLSVGILLGLYGDFSIATGVFIAKEIHDCYKEKSSGFSVADLIYDYVGFALGIVMRSYFMLLIK